MSADEEARVAFPEVNQIVAKEWAGTDRELGARNEHYTETCESHSSHTIPDTIQCWRYRLSKRLVHLYPETSCHPLKGGLLFRCPSVFHCVIQPAWIYIISQSKTMSLTQNKKTPTKPWAMIRTMLMWARTTHWLSGSFRCQSLQLCKPSLEPGNGLQEPTNKNNIKNSIPFDKLCAIIGDNKLLDFS